MLELRGLAAFRRPRVTLPLSDEYTAAFEEAVRLLRAHAAFEQDATQ